MVDPAVIDRSCSYIGPVEAAGLPRRDMTIAGIGGKAAARIFSKHPKGPASRFVELPAGWGADEPGAFTADVELFVIDGSLVVDARTVGPHCLVTMPEGAVISQLRTEHGLSGLLFTSAPVRFATAAPGGPADPAGSADPSGTGVSRVSVVSLAELDWETAVPGMLAKTVGGRAVTSRLVMAGHVETIGWTRLPRWSERYVIAGQWRERAWPGDEPGEAIIMEAESYVSRPADVAFDGPCGGTGTIALLLDRVVGPWVPRPRLD